MKASRYFGLTCVLAVGYAAGYIALANAATRALLESLELPEPSRRETDLLRGGVTGMALVYEDAGTFQGVTVKNLVFEGNFLSPLRMNWTFDLDGAEVDIQNIAIKAAIAPLDDQPVALKSVSIASLKALKQGLTITGARTAKSPLAPDGHSYLYEIDSMELGELDPVLQRTFGSVINKIAVTVTRNRSFAAGGMKHPSEHYVLDWELQSWGTMRLTGNGKLDLDGEKVSHGDFLLSAAGVAPHAVMEALRHGWNGALTVVVGTLGALCYTAQTSDGMTASVSMTLQGIYVQPQSWCQNLGAMPLVKFDAPVSQDDFYNTVGTVLY